MTGNNTFRYQGQELDLFAHATRWKTYWISRIRQWVRGDVLEVGAGVGANTVRLQNAAVCSWHCLEPDPELWAKLNDAIADLPACFATRKTITSLSASRFDCILYIDVLEHIKADRDELAAAARLLRRAGHIIVLSPAHQFLYSRFDEAIGHYRRYDQTSLRACSPPDCRLETMFYLDCIGMFLSLANRIILRQSTPTLSQIRTWDRYVIPLSRVMDPVFGYTLGRTIVGVWTRSTSEI